MIRVWISLFKVILDPKWSTDEDRRIVRLLSKILNVMGTGFVVLGLGSYLWSLQGNLLAPAPATKVVSVAEFSTSDLVGPLSEVLIDGTLQLDQIVPVRFPRNNILLSGQPTVVVPLTPTGWVAGDPVAVFVAVSADLLPKATPQERAAALAAEGLAQDSAGAVPMRALMAQSEIYGFEGDMIQVLDEFGLNPSADAVLLENIATSRDRKLANKFKGPATLGRLLLGLAAVMLGLALLGRRGLRKSDDLAA